MRILILFLGLFSLRGDAHPDYTRMDRAESDVLSRLPLDMNPVIVWRTCHEPTGNGYYYGHSEIVLCNENAEISHEFANYVALHELGHMAIEKYQVQVVGSEETAADEFATIMDLVINDGKDILASAAYFDTLDKKYPVPSEDSHPSFGARAETMRCIVRGYTESKSGCKYMWVHAITAWHRAIVDMAYSHAGESGWPDP